jgi:alkylhydroperoxidase family enzyme
MARIEPIPIRQWPPEMRDSLAAMTPPEPRHPQASTENRPKALNLLSTFAHYPALAKAFFTFNGHLLRATTLSERQRELLVLRVAVRTECRYEWGQHLLMANDAGIDDDAIERVELDPGSSHWSDIDAALLRAVDELIDDRVISADTWQVLSGELDTQQLLDLIYTVGAYATLAWMIRSVDIRLDDDLQNLVDTHLSIEDGSSDGR